MKSPMAAMAGRANKPSLHNRSMAIASKFETQQGLSAGPVDVFQSRWMIITKVTGEYLGDLGGFHLWGSPISAGWFIMENPSRNG
jgi:hypothetical protein